MTRPRAFNPDRVAYWEKVNYEAYYDRRWPLNFWTAVQLSRHALGMPWQAALLAAVDAARAFMAFKPQEGNDLPKARRLMQRYYERAQRYAPLAADARTLAELEVNWWIVHRELAIERMTPPHADNLAPLIAAFEHLHAALYGGDPGAVRRSAEYRARANEAVDRITAGYSEDVEADWKEVERCLREAYRALAADRATG